MPQKVLGLDIGETAVKAVLAARSMAGRSRVIAADVIPVDEAKGLEGVLDRLFAKTVYGGAECVMSMPAKAISYRNIKLPFRDRRKIDQTIAFELEPLIQHPIQEVYFDYVKNDTHDGAELFTAIVEKSFLDERLKILSNYCRSVAIIDVDAAACAVRASSAERKSFILLDIGMKNTAAVFVNHGKIAQMRYLAFGGSFMADRSDRFLTELRNTLQFLRMQGIMIEPAEVLLTGGGSLAPGIKESLQESLLLPVEHLDVSLRESIPIDESLASTWQPQIFNQALVLATRVMNEKAGFDFKHRLAAGNRRYDRLKQDIHWIGACAIIIAILIGTDAYLDYGYAKTRLDRVKKDVAAEFKKYMPETKRIIEPVSQLKSGIAEERKITFGLNIAGPNVKVLDMLKDVSLLTPTSVELSIRSFNLENGVIALKGEAKNFDAVETMKKEVAKSKSFKSVSIGATNLMKQSDRVEFEMKIEVRS